MDYGATAHRCSEATAYRRTMCSSGVHPGEPTSPRPACPAASPRRAPEQTGHRLKRDACEVRGASFRSPSQLSDHPRSLPRSPRQRLKLLLVVTDDPVVAGRARIAHRPAPRASTFLTATWLT